MRLLIALGGNALLKRGDAFDIDTQRTNFHAACKALVPLAEQHDLIITHGNGPQIGLLAQELRNLLPGRSVTNLLTQTLVDVDDGAFQHPTKFVGKAFNDEEAREVAKRTGWTMKLDGACLRRVVPAPEPKAVLELDAITTLVDAGSIVICAGGGGVPVVRRQNGRLQGVEAAVDKDLTSALLAREVQASALIMLTDVEGVFPTGGPAMRSCSIKSACTNLTKMTLSRAPCTRRSGRPDSLFARPVVVRVLVLQRTLLRSIMVKRGR